MQIKVRREMWSIVKKMLRFISIAVQSGFVFVSGFLMTFKFDLINDFNDCYDHLFIVLTWQELP